MRREKQEHLVTTGMIEGNRSKGKQRGKMLDGLPKWLNVRQVTNALKATKKAITTCTKEHSMRLIDGDNKIVFSLLHHSINSALSSKNNKPIV